MGEKISGSSGGSYKNALTQSTTATSTYQPSNTSIKEKQGGKRNSTQTDPAPQKNAIAKRCDKFRDQLNKAQDKVQLILDWSKKKQGGCFIHQMGETHQWFNCHHIRTICTECNAVDELATAIASRKPSRGGDPDRANAKARRAVTAKELKEMVKAKRAQSAPPNHYQQLQDNEEDEEYDTDVGSQFTSSTINDLNKELLAQSAALLSLYAAHNMYKQQFIVYFCREDHTYGNFHGIFFHGSILYVVLVKIAQGYLACSHF